MSRCGLKSSVLGVSMLISCLSANVMANDYQAYDLETFLRDFHNDPKLVMDKLPPKTESLDAAALSNPFAFSKENKTIVEAKDSVRRRFCSEVDGSKVCLDNPQGRAAALANDLAENLADNGTKLIRSLQEIEAKNLLNARVSTQPWSDDYWAIAKGILGARYADPANKVNTIDWKEALGYIEENPSSNYVESNKANFLSPSEKYDLLVGDKNMTLTQAMWAEGKHYYDANGSVEPWMGICHGWSPAAFMLPRPRNAVKTVTPDGTELLFYPADMKALGSLLWAKNDTPSKFIGGRCNKKNPKKDANGRILDQECFDNNPMSWHLGIVNQIGVSDRSFVMDATYDYEVWNQPVVGYQYRYFNVNTFDTAQTSQDATVALSDYQSDKFKTYRSPKAKSVVGVEMRVYYSVETQPRPRMEDNERYDAVTTATYRYDLEMDENGKLLGGEWYSNAHPDFMWTPEKDAKARSAADRYATGTWTWGNAVPARWQEVAPYASKAGIPLAKVVEDLLKQANKQ